MMKPWQMLGFLVLGNLIGLTIIYVVFVLF